MGKSQHLTKENDFTVLNELKSLVESLQPRTMPVSTNLIRIQIQFFACNQDLEEKNLNPWLETGLDLCFYMSKKSLPILNIYLGKPKKNKVLFSVARPLFGGFFLGL